MSMSFASSTSLPSRGPNATGYSSRPPTRCSTTARRSRSTKARCTRWCAAAITRSSPSRNTFPRSWTGPRAASSGTDDRMTQILFEEDGAFRVGTILAESGASLQVEAAHGKRSKIKAGNVLLRFDGQSLAGFMPEAQKLAHEIDPQFLWEGCGGPGFAFGHPAPGYFAHPPGPLAGPEDYFLRRFAFECFPRGTGFASHAPAVAPTGLEDARTSAFSIDDMETTEIDDAFSVARRADGRLEVGVHIAAPTLF